VQFILTKKIRIKYHSLLSIIRVYQNIARKSFIDTINGFSFNEFFANINHKDI